MAIPILNHLDLRSVSELQNAILHTTTHTAATNKAGAIIYDTGSSALKYCTGTSNSDWISLTGDTNTWRTVTVDTSGNGSADNTLETSETLMLKKGTNITLAEAGGVVTISSEDTTYSVGDGGLTTNDFTNADHIKLDGIEALANVTDTANVEAAGALMDSELASIAAVKATTGTFLTADQTKLDTIETSADVTDVTNVTAAGALMESELAGLAAVKATTGTFLSADESKLDAIEALADVTDTANVKSALNASFGGSATIGDGSDTITIPGDLIVTGDTIYHNETIQIIENNTIQFEGSDPSTDYEVKLTSEDATLSDKTITLPNLGGHVALFAVAPTVTISASPAELNALDGYTGSDLDTEFDGKQPLDAELTELATMASGTAGALADLSAAEVAILDGATLSTTELNYVDGVTSAIQTQLDAKQSAANVGTLIDARSSAHTITGDASATDFTITYGFTASATNDVIIQVVCSYASDTDYDGDTVFAEVERHSPTQCKIKFAAAPASGHTYRVLCFKIA